MQKVVWGRTANVFRPNYTRLDQSGIDALCHPAPVTPIILGSMVLVGDDRGGGEVKRDGDDGDEGNRGEDNRGEDNRGEGNGDECYLPACS
ncbi:hypothetical protein CPLU01_03677 [Colletotrichum plurivorum]|uniref:Uncharacterized protein n=1 Tax=Colletotrichum plurivorum TaxID=2175906 RepID=A0A8H6KSN6_9PEZI|nr:hypothetical protein CPLU01_03677 [Colletotrichum plurivorum]